MAQDRPITEAELEYRLARLPRVPLVRAPTPLEIAPRLSHALGIEVWFKRDDLTGGALSGNKGRVLEYVVGDALEQQADSIIVGGPIESNYPRALAAAAVKCGLRPFLVLYGDPRHRDTGNLLLARILGADVQLMSAIDPRANEAAKDALAARLAAEGSRPYVIRGDFAASPQAILGTIAYVGVAAELARQFQPLGLNPDAVFVASTGPTWAGLALGFDLLGIPTSVHGVGYVELESAVTSYSHWLTGMATKRLDVALPPRGHHPFDDRFVGPGVTTVETRDALLFVARTAGILIDPIYGAKAMASLLHSIGARIIPPGTRVVFVHTGGLPAVLDPLLSAPLFECDCGSGGGRQ